MALMAALAIWAAGTAAAEVRVTASPTEVRAGGIVDVTVTAGEGAGKVVYTLKNGSQTVFQGEEDTHFQASFRPRTEGEYTLEAEVTYGDGRTETGAVRVQAAGFEDEEALNAEAAVEPEAEYEVVATDDTVAEELAEAVEATEETAEAVKDAAEEAKE